VRVFFPFDVECSPRALAQLEKNSEILFALPHQRVLLLCGAESLMRPFCVDIFVDNEWKSTFLSCEAKLMADERHVYSCLLGIGLFWNLRILPRYSIGFLFH